MLTRNTIYDKKNTYDKDIVSKKDIRTIANILKYVDITSTINIFDKNIIKGMLNKLDINNKELVVTELLDYIETEEVLDEVFNEIFDTLLLQIKYIDVYVYIIDCLHNVYKERVKQNIDRYISNFNTILTNLSPKLNGYSVFLSIIANYKLTNNINNIIDTIINRINETNDSEIKQIIIESLFKIIIHLDKSFYTKELLDNIEYIKSNGNITNKSKFQLMDIIDEINK